MLRSFCLSLILLVGCAGGPLTEEELFEEEMRRSHDLENWDLCRRILKHHGRYTVHYDHQHGKRDKIWPWMIRDDLVSNKCQYIIPQEMWAR
jgi:hypothetical protein